jgi:flagellar hook-associated protein 3 FlgL
MRIATSTLYSNQTAQIDDQSALYAQLGTELSTGKKLNQPSDDPTQISEDLTLSTTIAAQTQQETNVTDATQQLTTTDSALANLTSELQSARTLAIQGASDTLSASQRSDIAQQIDEILQQTVAVGNTKYNNTYVFAGSAKTSGAPVQTTGNPISGVTFTGNEQEQGQLVYNGQNFALSTTFQSAFSYGSATGSPDVFQVLTTLRDSLANGDATDESATAINQQNQVVSATGAGTPLSTAGTFAVTPVPDNSVTVPAGGAYSIEIDGTNAAGATTSTTITIGANAPVDDATHSAASVVGAINAQTAVTGVTATYDAKSQRISLSGTGSFTIQDTETPNGATISGGGTVTTAATTTGNLVEVLNLTGQSDYVQNVSTQLGDIDAVLNQALAARSQIGSRIQALTAVSNQLATDVTDNTSTKSGIEGLDVAKATSQFTATQTALQAAYATTTRLESKTLFDYL